MREVITEDQFFIFLRGGDRMYLLGSDGNCLTDNDSKKAMWFSNMIDALTYVEKKGLQKVSTIRKVHK